MLARAASRSIRSSPTFLRTTLPYAHSRTFAKYNKPKRATDDNSPTPSPPVIKQTSGSTSRSSSIEAATVGSASTRSQGNSENETADSGGRQQDAFASSSESALKSQPTSPSSAPGREPIHQPQPDISPHPEYSKLQDEFETLKSSDANTTPQSTSPSAIDPAQVSESVRSQPLPDLTKGIPSTLDAELAEAREASKPSSLNVTEDSAETSPGGGRRGELPKSAYISSTDRKKERLANYMYAFLLGSSIVGCIYLGRNWEDEEEERKHPNAPSGWGVGLFYNRANARLTSTMDYFTEPTFPKLLPNVDPAWERPYTLVLSLEDLLVHSEWSREHGWRMAKRPGVDYFLRYLSQYYELVVFTSLPSK